MKDFKQRGSFGGKREGGFGARNDRGGYGEKRGGGDYPRRDSRDSRDSRGGGFGPAKFKATCSECGDSCELPFRPSGDRPVFCSNCFKGKENSRPSQFSDRSAKPSYERTASKPYVSQPTPAAGVSSEQLNKIDRKLDQILEFLNSIVVEEDEELEEYGEDEEMSSEIVSQPFVAEVVEKKIVMPAKPKKEAKKKSTKAASKTSKSKPDTKKKKK